jgi:hypothetical protein
MEEAQAPPAPVTATQSLPDLPDECSENTPPSRSPTPPTSPPIAGPSRSTFKRSRWSEDESGDESDEFTPRRHKETRAGKRWKASPAKRASSKLEGKGTACDLCGVHLGRATDLPRHRASCKLNPQRETRKTPCDFCGKLLPGNSMSCLSKFSYSLTLFTVRADAIKRHQESKTCLAKRKKGDGEDPYLSEP